MSIVVLQQPGGAEAARLFFLHAHAPPRALYQDGAKPSHFGLPASERSGGESYPEGRCATCRGN